jgi:predicted transposase/invertase (TIGR01784 family)
MRNLIHNDWIKLYKQVQIHQMLSKKKKNSQTVPPEKKQKLETLHEEELKEIYAKPTVDFTFMKLFGNDLNKSLTMDFLNSIFDFTGQEEIRKISFEHTVHVKRSEEEKMSILDVFCTDGKGRKFIIEVQLKKFVAFEKGVQYFCHKVHSSQQSTKSDYSDIYPVSTLIICDFKIFPPDVPCVSHHFMVETETSKTFLNETGYTFVELPKFEHKKDEKLISKDQWVFMLKNYREGPPKDPEKSIIEAFEILEMGKWTKEEINEYEKQIQKK